MSTHKHSKKKHAHTCNKLPQHTLPCLAACCCQPDVCHHMLKADATHHARKMVVACTVRASRSEPVAGAAGAKRDKMGKSSSARYTIGKTCPNTSSQKHLALKAYW